MLTFGYHEDMRPPGTPDTLERRRQDAIDLLLAGHTLSSVAHQMRASRSSVFRWWRMYQAGGKKGLASKPVPGRPSKLSRHKERFWRVLMRWLEEGEADHAWFSALVRLRARQQRHTRLRDLRAEDPYFVRFYKRYYQKQRLRARDLAQAAAAILKQFHVHYSSHQLRRIFRRRGLSYSLDTGWKKP